MSADLNKLEIIRQMVQSAQESINTAVEMLSSMVGRDLEETAISKKPTNGFGAHEPVDSDAGAKVIEGVFDGESMVGPDGKRYPVPPNYASKSKLVGGDILKLTITTNGAFVFKQIGPVERFQTVGILKKIGNDFIVKTDQGDFQVLTASITYFKAEPGDQITVIVPAGSSSGWAAIENIIPQTQNSVFIQTSEPAKTSSIAHQLNADDAEVFEVPKTLFKR